VLAYNLLHAGVVDMGEDAIAQTVIAPIKRQEPGHFAFYQISARGLWAQLAGWQRWMVRRMRSFSFAPVGANDATQTGVERELLWAHKRGLKVPPYVVKAFHDAVDLAEKRAAS
jgi:hypothetical protein